MRQVYEDLLSKLDAVCDIPYDQPLQIPNGLGPLIARAFRVKPVGNATQKVVPVRLVINTITGLPTDLPVGGHVIEVWIDNLVSDECLKKLAGSENGVHGLRYILDLIRRECRADVFASQMKLWSHVVRGRKVTAWNGVVKLKDTWGLEDLKIVYDDLNQADLFKLDVIDQNSCLPRTSSSTYNPDMSQRFWVSDTCYGGLLQRRQAPEQWKKALLTISAFHLNQANLSAVKKTISNPDWYRKGEWWNGVAHIFLLHDIHGNGGGAKWENGIPVPNSLREDPAWGNRKRLESQALTLQRILETIIAGTVENEPNASLRTHYRKWGVNWATQEQEVKNILLSSIKVIASYLLSVQWNGYAYDMLAPTVSSWEEIPIFGGCTSDVAFMVDAFRLLHRVLFDKEFEKFETLREELRSSVAGHEGHDYYEMLHKCKYADFRIEDNILKFIKAGERYLSERVIKPASKVLDSQSRASAFGLAQSEVRPMDTSLCLLAYHRFFDPNPARHGNTIQKVLLDVYRSLGHSNRNKNLGFRRYGQYQSSADENGNSYWLIDSYQGLRFVLGLIAPNLVRHHFAELVSDDYSKIAPFMDCRINDFDSASPRDMLVRYGYEKFCGPQSVTLAETKKDAMSPWDLYQRQQFQLPEWSPYWTIGPSASLIGLAKAKISVLTRVMQNSGWSEVLSNLYTEIQELLDEITNLNLKTIVANKDNPGDGGEGRPILRADGSELPCKLNVMECFQAVLTSEGKVAFLPGDHTLMWSMVQVEKGLRLSIEAAELALQVFQDFGEPE